MFISHQIKILINGKADTIFKYYICDWYRYYGSLDIENIKNVTSLIGGYKLQKRHLVAYSYSGTLIVQVL